MSDSKSESIDHISDLGVLVMSTIGLLDITKGKLHPLMDSVNTLSLTVDDIRDGHFLTRDPELALARVQRKAIDSLKDTANILRSVADSMDGLTEGIEQNITKRS